MHRIAESAADGAEISLLVRPDQVVHARLASGTRLDARLDTRETWREGDEGIAVVPEPAAAFAADEPAD